jgi:hypothetical protein
MMAQQRIDRIAFSLVYLRKKLHNLQVLRCPKSSERRRISRAPPGCGVSTQLAVARSLQPEATAGKTSAALSDPNQGRRLGFRHCFSSAWCGS